MHIRHHQKDEKEKLQWVVMITKLEFFYYINSRLDYEIEVYINF
jgi:hypothetical protein